jgi:heme exporter protein C
MSKVLTIVFLKLCVLAAVGFVVAPFLIFFVAPTEPIMGFVQKIFYFHVPCAWAMLLGAVCCGVGGGVYLFRRSQWAAELCTASAGLTVLFGTLVLITGPLWAKVAWGHFWVWDVRLTTVLILYLIFVAVLITRRLSGPSGQKIAAGLALFGAIDVPLIYVSVKIWKTIHPDNSVVASLHPGMKPAFFLSLATFTLVYVILLWLRLRLERSRHRLDQIYVAVQERELGRG